MKNNNAETKKNQDKLKKIRKNPFTQIENAILEDPEITKNELLIFWVLNYHADKNDECFPGLKKISDEARLSKPAVIKAINGLVKKGYITKEKRTDPENPKHNFTNLYTIVAQYKYVKKTEEELKQPEKQENNRGVVNPVYQGSKPSLPEQYKDNNTNNDIGKKEGFGGLRENSISNSSPPKGEQRTLNKKQKSKKTIKADKDGFTEKILGSSLYTELLSLGLNRMQCYTLAKLVYEQGGKDVLELWIKTKESLKYLKEKAEDIGKVLYKAVLEDWEPGEYYYYGREKAYG